MLNWLNNINLKKCIFIYIVIYCFFILILVLIRPLYQAGECGNYTLTTIALQYEKSIFYTDKTIKILENIFPVYKESAIRDYTTGRYKTILYNETNLKTSYYFPSYSAICIPMSIFLKTFGLDQSYAFVLTNALLFIISLFAILFYLKISDKDKLLLILALSLSPIMYYLSFVGNEIFIYVFIIFTMIFYINKSYKLAAIFLTIASSMNLTVMGLAPFLCISYFINLNEIYGTGNNILKLIKNKIKDIFLFGLSFLFIIPVFIYNYLASSSNNKSIISTGTEYADISFLFDRFFAYLFDFNHGFLPWFSFIFCLFIIFFFISILYRNYKYIIPSLGFFLIVFGYSIMIHINSGMSGISRYNAWASPIMLFIVITSDLNTINNIKNNMIIKFNKFLNNIKIYIVIISILISMILLKNIGFPIEKYGYIDNLPHSKLILDNFPSIYNPFYSTFISRVEHRDGGYNYIKPVFYLDSKNKLIRKILIDKNDNKNLVLLDKIYFLDESSKLLFNELIIKSSKSNKSYIYINIPKNIKIMNKEFIYYSFDPTVHSDLTRNNLGIYQWEQTFHWFSPNATIWLKAGNICDTGMQLKFMLAPYIKKYNNNENLKTDIFIDNIFIKSILLDDMPAFEEKIININNTEIPKNINEIIKINLITNGEYNPNKQDFSNIDKRDLAIGVMYIGPIR